MRYPCLILLAVLLVGPTCYAADLADEANAWKKLPDYVNAIGKLTVDIKKLPDYVEAMKKVHAKFTGTPGIFVCWGDSISQQKEYWSPLKNGGKNMDPRTQQAYNLIKDYIKPECWDWKGSKYGNEGGMTSLWARDNIGKWLKEMNPEAVVILFGSNDQDRSKIPPEQQLADYEQAMTEVVQKCLANGTVVILTTVPPRRNRRSDIYSEKMIKLAARFNLPVCDYLGEIIKRRPDDWDGSTAKFKAFEKYEVPTLICGDGEHPSHPQAFADDYSAEGLQSHGCDLHTYVTLLAYADVVHKVFGVPLPAGTPAATRPGR